MLSPPDPAEAHRFLARLRSAGIEASDSEEQRLNKSLLAFATGLVTLASMLWLTIYWLLGPNFSTTMPFLFQALLVGNYLFYILTRQFDFFRATQLGLFLFVPFIVQWSMGNFISASGIVLWGLLAPIGAILCFGVRESLAWFIAWVFLTLLSAGFDLMLLDSVATLPRGLTLATSIIFFALNFVAVASIIYVLLRHSTQERNGMSTHLEDAHAQLRAEQERSDRLLRNILPGPVAERLKNSVETIADGYADVTVMFADIVNFTQVAANMSPQQVFAMLNRIFSNFDELAEHYGLEKIKTIGDAYMVAGGLEGGPRDYTEAVALMALAMRAALERDNKAHGGQLSLRIGIGSGPVVAGVVGKKKFIYDLWGDTVNLASRITAEGPPGMIQVDAASYERLCGRFEFDGPLTLYLKGKGEMPVWRLVRENPAAGLTPPSAFAG